MHPISCPRPHSLSLVALAFFACGATEPSFEQAVADSIAVRASGPESLAVAFELADVAPLAAAPAWSAAAADPSRLEFWRAAAFAFAPGVRAARHAYQETVDLAGGAGSPGTTRLDVEAMEDAPVSAAITFDLLGILGIGRSAAAQELADENRRAALATLEQAVFDADFGVARARARVLVAQDRLSALGRLAGEVAADAARIRILASDGFVPPAETTEALGQSAAVSAARDAAEAELFAARATLARASGLQPTHSALGPLAGEIEWSTPPARAIDPLVLLARIPELRRVRLEYAVAEAELRRATAEWWPEVAVGPSLTDDDPYLVGGVVRVDVAWPSGVIARVRAAEHRRDRAREVVEEALIDWQGRAVERTARARAAGRNASELAPAADEGAEAAWRAARARFATDPARLPEWSIALERRVLALMAVYAARQDAALASIDASELDGIGPTPEARP